MHTTEIIGYRRSNLGKQNARQLRTQAYVPGVLYGGSQQVHFYTPMALLRQLVYTRQAYFVSLNIETSLYECILQDVQLHPVSDIILHVDFLQIFGEKKIKMDIPTVLVGDSPGVARGGRLVNKINKVPVSAYPPNMPDQIQVDISQLDLGQMIRVRDIQSQDYVILAPPGTPLVTVAMTRALRTAGEAAETKDAKK